MLIITGAAGFIGSNLARQLNEDGRTDLILVDDFSSIEKTSNLSGLHYHAKVHRSELFDWLKRHNDPIEFIFHIGARTDTTLFDYDVFEELNINYSKKIWEYCCKHHVPMLYASSAATYGNGELGYDDDTSLIPQLKPLNPYGESKNDFDNWVLQQQQHPPHWYGLKFFNVYGPYEYHKGRMASVVLHAYNQIKQNETVNLFKSHRTGYADGEQLRDFVYVKDVISVILFLFREKPADDIYNLGTGKARTFKSLATAIFDTLQLPVSINYIDTPLDIRDKYQYFTEAKMGKLLRAGYNRPFSTLEEGVADYVQHYLVKREAPVE